MRNFSSVVPTHSVYRISRSAFSDERLAWMLTIIVNRKFENNDSFDWDKWTPSEARVIASLEDWISDCRGKTARNLPTNLAFSYANVNTGETVLFVWHESDSNVGFTDDVDSLLYRVQPEL